MSHSTWFSYKTEEWNFHYYHRCSMRGEVYIGFRCENLWEIDHLGDSGLDEQITFGWMFRKLDVGVWTGLS